MFGASENRYLGTNDRLGQGQNPGVGGREHSYWEAPRLHEFRIWLYSKKSSSSAQRMEDGAGAGKAGWGWGPVCSAHARPLQSCLEDAQSDLEMHSE